ncbi:MAG: hypothetical protein D6B27_02125 [Gammaproteobacteria bacterium]|nr:MAG: hypothetical protein D6B27_02125 [Gammaproteobacteria bacterium]
MNKQTNTTDRQETEELKHSGFGITSVWLSFISILLIAAILIAAKSLPLTAKGFPMVVLALGFCLVLQFFSLGFAISGLMQTNRFKLFAKAGLVMSLLIVTLFISVFIYAVFIANPEKTAPIENISTPPLENPKQTPN